MKGMRIVLLFVSFLSFSIVSNTLFGKNIKLKLQAGDFNREDCPVFVGISDCYDTSCSITLYEIDKGRKKEVNSQIVEGKNGDVKLYWISQGVIQAGTERVYLMKTNVPSKKQKETMTVQDTQKELILKKKESPILAYHYGMCYPPQGVSEYFKRSGFIHPVYSPGGYRLTRIQAPDHYHHYGVWNPWTRVSYNGKTYDLWNLGDRQGTVRASDSYEVLEGGVIAGYSTTLNHVAFVSKEEKVIMKETVEVKAWDVPGIFLWDFKSTLVPSTDLPVIIKEYRYAGFSWRSTEEWTRENCIMMTSEGNTRQEIDGTTGRWIYITGESPVGKSGILFLSHPDNYNHPEPLRIWDEKANEGRGDAFINFSPTKNKDWELSSGQEYTLRYRVITYDGEMTPERGEQLWIDYAYPPQIKIQ